MKVAHSKAPEKIRKGEGRLWNVPILSDALQNKCNGKLILFS